MTPTIDTILADVDRLDNAATPGPWRVAPLRASMGRWIAGIGRSWITDSGQCIAVISDGPAYSFTERCDADAELVAAYRTHAVTLAAEVRRLRAIAAGVTRNDDPWEALKQIAREA